MIAMSRRWASALAALVVVVGASGCSTGSDELVLDAVAWSAPSTDDTTVTLTFTRGSKDAVERSEVVTEDDDSVTVDIVVKPTQGDLGMVAVIDQVDVELASPIGDRTVLNRDGSVVPRQEQPEPTGSGG